MKQNRVEAVLKNMESLNLSQILITDPLAIFYLTGRMIKPFERFYALYLNQNGNHKIFINQLETVRSVKEMQDFFFRLSTKKLPPVFVNASLALDQARAVKDIQEQELMRKASHLNDMAMAEITHFFKEGVPKQILQNN